MATAHELLGEFLENNRGDYISYGVYMVPPDEVAAEAGRKAGEWIAKLGLDFCRNCDAIIIGLGDHLLVIKDRQRPTPYVIRDTGT